MANISTFRVAKCIGRIPTPPLALFSVIFSHFFFFSFLAVEASFMHLSACLRQMVYTLPMAICWVRVPKTGSTVACRFGLQISFVGLLMRAFHRSYSARKCVTVRRFSCVLPKQAVLSGQPLHICLLARYSLFFSTVVLEYLSKRNGLALRTTVMVCLLIVCKS